VIRTIFRLAALAVNPQPPKKPRAARPKRHTSARNVWGGVLVEGNAVKCTKYRVEFGSLRAAFYLTAKRRRRDPTL